MRRLLSTLLLLGLEVPARWRFGLGLPAPGRKRGDLWGGRYEWVRQLAPGKSFIDLGGMWGVNGRIAFLAEEVGAERVVLFDVMDPTDEFLSEHALRHSSVTYIQGDLADDVAIAGLGRFDVVWCTGLIYHSPNPYQLIMNLRQLTRERLVLGTHVLPDVPFVPNLCLFLPGLPRVLRDAFASRLHGKESMLWGLTTDFDYTPGEGYRNCWWMLSHTAVRSMLETESFQWLETNSDSPYWLDVLTSPTAGPALIPTPLSREA